MASNLLGMVQPSSDGLQPNRNGLQPGTSNGLHFRRGDGMVKKLVQVMLYGLMVHINIARSGDVPLHHGAHYG